MSKFECKQCGNCCLNLYDAYQTTATKRDYNKWKKLGRDDILFWVDPDDLDIWISPRTNEYVERCPWLRKVPRENRYTCRIYDLRPKHCREYPDSREHAEETDCKGFKRCLFEEE